MKSAVSAKSAPPVLYAEDEEDDAFLMHRAFDEARIARPLFVVQDGHEAIEYLRGAGRYSDRHEFPIPCLLLLDLKLPRKSGLEVLKWIRNETTVSTLPVIVLSSSLQDADIHRAYVQGANAYLVKPSEPGELSRMVETIRDFWLGHNRSTETSWDAFGAEWNRPKTPL